MSWENVLLEKKAEKKTTRRQGKKDQKEETDR